jgi:hypothetical protein
MENSDTPIKNLQELKDWLGKQTPGGTVAVAASMFDAPLVATMFKLLPATESITVNNAAITVDTATLSGTGTMLEEPDCTITFIFTQPADKLLCQLQIQLPATVKWRLIQNINLAFTELKATLVPNAELNVVNMNLFSIIEAGETGSVKIPVNLTVPSFDGDWLLSTGEVKIGNITADVLQALAGDVDLTTIMPDQLKILEKFELKTFSMKFNPQKQTLSFIHIAIAYNAEWKFFNDQFIVRSIVLDFEISNPLLDAKSRQYHCTLLGNIDMADGNIPIQVGGTFPDKVVFARLPAGRSLLLTKAFQFFKVPLPAGFPDIEISTLGFIFYVETKGFNFKLSITKPIPIIGKVQLDNFLFDIGADFNVQTGKMLGYGTLRGQFSIGKTIVSLAASYKEDQGVEIYGAVYNLPIGELLHKLLTDFGIEGIPEFLSSINLKKLLVIYNTGTGDFTFECNGTLMVAKSDMSIAVSLKAVKELTGFKKKIHAEGTIEYKEQVFTIKFDDASMGTAFTAIWKNKGTPLSINSVAGLIGLGDEVPPIPEELNNVLSLSGASFTYDTSDTHKAFLLTATSTVLGKADFVALNSAATSNQWQFFFGLATGKEINLANLPILDKLTLIDQGKLAIEAIQVNIASVIVTETIKKAVDDIIKKYAPDAMYPMVPQNGMTEKVAFSMTINIGGNKIVIGIGPSGKKAMLPPTAATAAYQPVPVAAAAGNMLVVWFNLQKNFGPIYFDKIGIGYQNSHIFVLVNAMATASGLSIALNGFGVGLHIKTFDIAFNIDGISITYTSNPILLSAGFQGTIKPVDLTGSFLIKTTPITIGGIGGYTEVDNKPSMFLFAVLNAPIGGPPFFFVKGVAAGFGYNRKLVIPDITGVATFPFVVWAMGGPGTPSPDPNGDIKQQVNGVLSGLVQKGTVAPQAGSHWLAAGIRFTSFEIVDSFALLTVIFGTSVEVSLLGLSRLTVPMGASASSGVPVVAYAELAIKATYSQQQSLVSIEGQLTNNSFVLAQACHLTGGFAFYFWFGGEFEGDFVVSLGGYNANYSTPKHYPRVPRLGFNWQVIPELIIKGELYFALTSNAVMAGGLLEAVWQSGGIKAWFIVRADFLIMFKPFHYDIRAAVDLGASFRIDLLFTSVVMTIHVGVSLHIWGPKFAGEATIHLYIISFTLSFGDSSQDKPRTIDWKAFSKEMLPQKKGSARTAINIDDPDPDVCKLIVASGLIKQLSENDGELNWIVNPEKFVLTTQSIIPSKSWTFSKQFTVVEPGPDDPKPNTDFGVRPVGIESKDFVSEHSITLTSNEDTTFYAYYSLKNVPKALWKEIKFDNDGNPILGDPVNDTTIKNVVTGFTLVPYVPEPGHTLPIPLEYLQYTIDPNIQKFWWSKPFVPTTDNVQGKTVPDTIMSKLATDNRNLLLQAIINNDVMIDKIIDVDGLAQQSTSYLLADPLMRLLGEEKQN